MVEGGEAESIGQDCGRGKGGRKTLPRGEEAEAAAKCKDAAAEAEAKRQRRGRGIDARLCDARMADLDEVSKRLRKRLQFLAAQRDKRGRGRWRRRDTSPAVASSAGQRGKRGRGHWRRQDRWPAAASSEELAAGSESQVALMLQLAAPGEEAGSFLMAPGQVFASLAVAVAVVARYVDSRRGLELDCSTLGADGRSVDSSRFAGRAVGADGRGWGS